MATDRDVLFEQWSFRAGLAAGVLLETACHLSQRFDEIGSIHAEQAYAACAADVAQLVQARDTEGLLSLADRVKAGTYEPLVDAIGGDDATTE